MKFDGCPNLRWGTDVNSECSEHSISGNPVFFTPYMHRFSKYMYPAGFVIETEDHEYAFGQTVGTDAIAQRRKPIEGNIVGFNYVKGGNVDYWGLVVAKQGEVQSERPTVVIDKSKKPPCGLV